MKKDTAHSHAACIPEDCFKKGTEPEGVYWKRRRCIYEVQDVLLTRAILHVSSHATVRVIAAEVSFSISLTVLLLGVFLHNEG